MKKNIRRNSHKAASLDVSRFYVKIHVPLTCSFGPLPLLRARLEAMDTANDEFL